MLGECGQSEEKDESPRRQLGMCEGQGRRSGRGLIWAKSGEAHVKKDDWNDYEIVAQGTKIRTYLNGKVCVDLDDPAGTRRGIFALQIHSGPAMEVRFRDLRLEVGPFEKR